MSYGLWLIHPCYYSTIQHLLFMNTGQMYFLKEEVTGQLYFFNDFIRDEQNILQQFFFSTGHVI